MPFVVGTAKSVPAQAVALHLTLVVACLLKSCLIAALGLLG